ncbi:hypothetical protein ACIA8C_33655 [Nocardia sp. NPDC051321]|uniref:hypothetical protein n=1 Tax=Nocardia sp. NPDC051321 TaxID=3364323 RepID=UPI0037B2774A
MPGPHRVLESPPVSPEHLQQRGSGVQVPDRAGYYDRDGNSDRQNRAAHGRLRIDPAAVARAIAFAIDQPADVEIGDLTIRRAKADFRSSTCALESLVTQPLRTADESTRPLIGAITTEPIAPR